MNDDRQEPPWPLLKDVMPLIVQRLSVGDLYNLIYVSPFHSFAKDILDERKRSKDALIAQCKHAHRTRDKMVMLIQEIVGLKMDYSASELKLLIDGLYLWAGPLRNSSNQKEEIVKKVLPIFDWVLNLEQYHWTARGDDNKIFMLKELHIRFLRFSFVLFCISILTVCFFKV
jgi:hypothetical protein